MITEREQEIMQSFLSTGSTSETAQYLGISRQRVHQVVKDYRSKSKKDFTPSYYRDCGCEDKEYPSCLNCPLKKCKYDKR